MLRATWKLSSDGSTLTDYYREFNPDGSNSNISMDYVYQRTGGGGSGFAADWQSIKETMNFPLILQVKPFEGDGLSFITPSEQRTKSAKFDGKEYPNEGSNAGHTATSSIRRVDDRNLVMTDKYDGNVAATQDIALSADGKVLTITTHITRRDKPIVMTFNRQ